MKFRSAQSAIAGLRWTVGLVLVMESLRFALSSTPTHLFPAWVPPVLGGSEAAAAILFLIPAASAALLVIFALAALIHILHGQYDIGSLAVYAVAVLVCRTAPAPGVETPHER